MPNDEKLVEEIIGGSEAAMEVLTKRYYKLIFAFVYRKVGNRDLAYDLTQETFIKMMKRIDNYSNKGKFKSWLYAIAVNHCRDHWKSLDYQATYKQSELSEKLTSASSDISYIFEQKEVRKRIKTEIEKLPEYQKEVVLLRFYHDLKFKEIAHITSTNESTAKTRLRQGLKKLHAVFKREEENNEKEFIRKK